MAQIRDATQHQRTRVLQPRETQQKQKLRKATSVMPRNLIYDSDPPLSFYHFLSSTGPHLTSSFTQPYRFSQHRRSTYLLLQSQPSTSPSLESNPLVLKYPPVTPITPSLSNQRSTFHASQISQSNTLNSLLPHYTPFLFYCRFFYVVMF